MSEEPAAREPLRGQDAGPEPEAPPDLAPAPPDQDAIRPGDKPDELLVFDHGFVRLDGAMADDLSVVNGARVSFAVRKEVMDERDKGLIRFLMRDRHGSPFEHNSFRFHIRAPIFVAREWFRHRIGCLTGDTMVTFVDGTGHDRAELHTSVDELWRRWRASDASKGRVRAMRPRVLDEDRLEFGLGRVAEVVDSGVQPVYRLVLDDGKTLELTENHRLLTDRGWKALRDAVDLTGRPERVTGACRVMTNGVVAPVEPVSAAPVTTLIPAPVRIAACNYVGLRQTYDLCVQGPWHNFVANGIVVHNSFNEESARYHKLKSDFYVPAIDAVRSQVGKPGSYSFEPVDAALAEDARTTFRRVYAQLYEEYQGLIDKGVAKELARALLPFGIFTQFYWTLNARSLMNFLSLRNSSNAQYEIRTYAEAVERLFAGRMPMTHECFEEFGRQVP